MQRAGIAHMLRQLFLFLLALATTANEACTAGGQQQALVDVYKAWGGTKWHNSNGWLDNVLECKLKGTQFPV
eukprot:scaffold143149_cov23-Tisochrysis_lutea.AAC.2